MAAMIRVSFAACLKGLEASGDPASCGGRKRRPRSSLAQYVLCGTKGRAQLFTR